MNYLLSLLVALSVLLLALGLVVVQRRLAPAWRVGIVAVVFLGGVLTNYVVASEQAPGFAISLQQTMEWTYSALTMFAGAGSVEVIEDVVTPSGVPVSVVQMIHYFLQVFAFLFTISAVVAALARDGIDRMVVRFTRYDEVYEIDGWSQEAQLIARSIASWMDGEAPSGKRRLLAVVPRVDLSKEEHAELHARIAIIEDPDLVRAKLARARRGRVFVVDTNEPRFADALASRIEALDLADTEDLVLFVIARSPATRDLVASRRTSFEIRCTELSETASRDLVQRWAPFRSTNLCRGEAAPPFSALVVSDGGAQLEHIVEQLVIHSQFLGGLPRIRVLSSDAYSAGFAVRHPEVGLSADLEVTVGQWGTPEAYALSDDTFSMVVIAFSDPLLGLEVSHDLRRFHRLHRSTEPLPRFLVRGESADSSVDELTFFGSEASALSAAHLLDDRQDDLARQVNAYYSGLDPTAPDYRDQCRKRWRELTWVNRASSRASADHAETMAAVWSSAASSPSRDAADVAARTEHLRWNAFYRMLGYQRMSVETMAARFAEHRRTWPDEDVETAGRYARDDSANLRHVCLVEWADLPAIDVAYNGLSDDLRPRDFQQTDRDVIQLVEAVVGLERSSGSPHRQTSST